MNERKPEISIIVPVHNSEAFLDLCVESLLGQDFADFELLLIDDGSTDRSVAICDKWEGKDSRVRVFHRKCGSAGAARNAGIAHSQGHWLCFVDSDDYVSQGFLSSLRASAGQGVMPVCSVQGYGGQVFSESFSGRHALGKTEEEFFSEAMSSLLLMAPWGKLYETEIVMANDLRFKADMKIGEDTLFVFTYMTYINNVCFVPDARYNYMSRPTDGRYALDFAEFARCSLRLGRAVKKLERSHGLRLAGVKKHLEGIYRSLFKLRCRTVAGNFYRSLRREFSVNSAAKLVARLWNLLPQFGKEHLQNCGGLRLEDVWPDKGNGCLCENALCPIADLHIVVPVYNVEKYVCQCLDSIFGQKTSFSFFVTVVNDGSTDGSRELIKRYESLSNVEIIDQSNAGLGAARNSALCTMKGRYVCFVDSDDVFPPGAVEALMGTALETGADIVEGSVARFCGQRELSPLLHGRSCGEVAACKLLGYAWGKAFKAELFLHVHFPEGYWFEDTVCSLILFQLAKSAATIPAFVYRYRENPEGICASANGNPRSLEGFYVTRTLLRDAATLRLPLEKDYDSFLEGIVMDYRNIHSLDDKNLMRALFVETCKLAHSAFPECHTSCARLKPLERALRTGNYALYRLCVC